ncbi:MAG: hypothetical protein E7497_03365 [Ruminococcus sp.]|nr:hypothetical protein [Ruminococcus sp.]
MARTTKKAAAETETKTVKAAETVAEAAPAAPAAQEAKEVKKPAAKKPAAKKPAAKKTAAKAAPKAAAKKPAAKKTAAKTVASVYIQLDGAEVTSDALVEKAKANSGVKSAKKIDVYVRPEINMVYYVIDGETFGNFELF